MTLTGYIKDCFKRVNAILKQNKCKLHVLEEPIGYEPYIESVKSIYPVGSRTEAEFKVIFPSTSNGSKDDVAATFVLHFDEYGQVSVGSEVTALVGGAYEYKRGRLKSASLGWSVDWDE